MEHKLHISGEFCSCGNDTYVCQACGRILCSEEYPSTWAKIKLQDGREFSGNVCNRCVESDKLHARKIEISTVVKIGGNN